MGSATTPLQFSPYMDQQYCVPGFDFSTLTIPHIRNMLEAHGIEFESSDKKHLLIAKAERLYGDMMIRTGQWSHEYLDEGFDPTTMTIPMIRQVLSTHEITYNDGFGTEEDDKEKLCNLFLENLDVMRAQRARKLILFPNDGDQTDAVERAAAPIRIPRMMSWDEAVSIFQDFSLISLLVLGLFTLLLLVVVGVVEIMVQVEIWWWWG